MQNNPQNLAKTGIVGTVDLIEDEDGHRVADFGNGQKVIINEDGTVTLTNIPTVQKIMGVMNNTQPRPILDWTQAESFAAYGFFIRDDKKVVPFEVGVTGIARASHFPAHGPTQGAKHCRDPDWCRGQLEAARLHFEGASEAQQIIHEQASASFRAHHQLLPTNILPVRHRHKRFWIENSKSGLFEVFVQAQAQGN